MPDPFKARLTEKNPLPARQFPADECPLHASGQELARDGYAALDRANPRDPYSPSRRGIAAPATPDGPNIARDERRYVF